MWQAFTTSFIPSSTQAAVHKRIHAVTHPHVECSQECTVWCVDHKWAINSDTFLQPDLINCFILNNAFRISSVQVKPGFVNKIQWYLCIRTPQRCYFLHLHHFLWEIYCILFTLKDKLLLPTHLPACFLLVVENG